MFIEQIIEFELRRPGPLGCTRNPKTSYFCDKTKLFVANLQVKYYLLMKMMRKVMYLAFPSPGQSQLQNLSKNAMV